MRYVMPALAVLAVAALAGCDRSGVPSTSTTVVKEPTVVQKEKETVREVPPANSSSTTAPASSSASVDIDANKPQTTETSRTRTTTHVDTPAGSATRTQTDTTKTTQ